MLCNDMGLSMTAAFTIFAKTVTRENLQRVAAELNAGKSVEHEIIED